jgi:glutathione synthase/RimK-type ligase-like ATP-grasp enzyme
MFVTIHKDRYDRFDPFCEIFEKILDYNDIPHMRVDSSDIDFWDNVKKSDLFIYRWIQWDDHLQIAKSIMPIIEYQLGITCLPDQRTAWHYDDKIKQYYMLHLKGYPFIDTWVFYDKKKALQWLDTVQEYPLVFKLKGGAASHNVLLAKSKRMATSMINKMFGKGITSDNITFGDTTRTADFNIKKFVRHQGGNLLRKWRGEDAEAYWQLNKNYVLFQKFLPGNKFDTRIYVVGGRALAFRRMVRKNDFRASGSGNNDFNPDMIDRRCIKIALQISEEMQFQAMAYDFLYDQNNEPLIAEISYASIGRVLHQCPGYWDKDLNFNPGNNWIQFFQLRDALKLPGLKQPDNLVENS